MKEPQVVLALWIDLTEKTSGHENFNPETMDLYQEAATTGN